MAFWEGQVEPLRKNRWKMNIPNFKDETKSGGTGDQYTYALKKVDKPKAKIGEITHKYMNHFFYYPGRLEWEATLNYPGPQLDYSFY